MIKLYIYNRNYTHTHIAELCQLVFIYNHEAQCTSHTACAQVLELPENQFGYNQESTLFSGSHMFYAHLASVRFARFERSVCGEYIYISRKGEHKKIINLLTTSFE